MDIQKLLPKCSCGEPKWWEILGHDHSGHTDHYAVKCQACGVRYYVITWREQAVMLKVKKNLPDAIKVLGVLNGWIAQVLEPYWLHHYSLWLVADQRLSQLILDRAFDETEVGYCESPDAMTPEDQERMTEAMTRITEEWPRIPEPVLYPPHLPDIYNGWFKVSLRPGHHYWEQINHMDSESITVPKHNPSDFADIER